SICPSATCVTTSNPSAGIVDGFFAGQIAADNDEDGIFLRLASEISHFFVPLVLIWALINAPSLLQLERVGAQPKEGSQLPNPDSNNSDTADTAEAEFWARVPGRLGRELVALSAELHYLRVHTTNGDTLILFPFGRAVGILQDQNGMQIHRSHWIALDKIDEVVTRDGRMMCQMIGGLSVPVSRSYRAALKAARRPGS
ncbi:MAG: LytTR family DNA-binding domain-containing protein, partial [Pseudomonadota bacterium]